MLLVGAGPGRLVAGFLLPSALLTEHVDLEYGDRRAASGGERLLDWEQVQKLPRGVLLLFGCGLSLAAALADHGVDAFIADAFSRLGTVPDGLLVGGAVALTPRSRCCSAAGSAHDGR